jgi:hypothetical protein
MEVMLENYNVFGQGRISYEIESQMGDGHKLKEW